MTGTTRDFGLWYFGLLMCSFFFKHLFPRLLLSSMLLLMMLSNFRSCPMALLLLLFVNSGFHVCSPFVVFLCPLVFVLFSFILVLMMSSYFLSCLIAPLALVSIALEFDFFLVSLCLLSSWYEYWSRHSFILWCCNAYWYLRTPSRPSFASFQAFMSLSAFGALAALASDIDS